MQDHPNRVGEGAIGTRPKTTGKGLGLLVRVPPPELARLDAWIGRQIEPRPTRPEAIRKLVETALGEPMPQMTKPDMVLKRQTSRKEAANANILQATEQSSEATLGKMDKALAERAFTKIKGKRTRRKVAKRK